eukprot:1193944-Prorocentrum_minimum.AAC.6
MQGGRGRSDHRAEGAQGMMQEGRGAGGSSSAHSPADAVALQALLLNLKRKRVHRRAQVHRHVRELRLVHLGRRAPHRRAQMAALVVHGRPVGGMHGSGHELLVRIHGGEAPVVAKEGGLVVGAGRLRVRRRLRGGGQEGVRRGSGGELTVQCRCP